MEKPRMERRAGTRITNMIKHAEMIFEGNVLDCVQLDISSGGTRIYLDGSVEIPDVVTIQMYDGTSRRARRLWQRGSQIGFDFLTEHETDARDLALGPEGK